MRGRRVIERFGAEARLARGHQQRTLGRVALDGPPSVLLLHGRVVRAIGGCECAFELHAKRAVDRPAAFPLDGALRRVSGSLERDAPARGHHDANRHLIPRERAGLVRRDDGRGSERFHGGQVPDDGVAARHPLDANRQHRRDDRRQPLGHRRHGEGDPENQDVEQCRRSADVFDEDDRRNHHDGDRHDDDAQDLAGAIQLALQRRGLVGRLFQQSRDAPHFGLHPGRRHNRLAVPVGGRGAAEQHVVAVAQCDVALDRPRVLGHRQAFAGQRRLGRLQRRRFDQPCVGRDRVAFRDENEIPGHEIRGRDAAPLAAAHHRGMGRGHRAKRRDGRFGARLLEVADRRVQQHDGEDGDRFVREGGVAFDDPERERDGCGDEQQDDEDVLELREETAPSRNGRLGRELVAAEAFEASRRFGVLEPATAVGPERRDHLPGGLPVRNTRVGCLARGSRCTVSVTRFDHGGDPRHGTRRAL